MMEAAIPQRLLWLVEMFQFHSTGGINVAFVMGVTPGWEHPRQASQVLCVSPCPDFCISAGWCYAVCGQGHMCEPHVWKGFWTQT